MRHWCFLKSLRASLLTLFFIAKVLVLNAFEHHTLVDLTNGICKKAPEYSFGLPDNIDYKSYISVVSQDDLNQVLSEFFEKQTDKENDFVNPACWQGAYKALPDSLKCLGSQWESQQVGTSSYPYLFKSLYPYVQKLIVPIGSTVCFMGDFHGSIHSLVRNLWKLVALGYLDQNFKIKKPNFYLIFLGDLVDRGRNGCEVIYTYLRLKLANFDRVFLTRGNHENHGLTSWMNFQSEVEKKYPGDMYNKFLKFFELLPWAIFLGSGEPAEFVQCCHGGIETGFDSLPLRQSPPNVLFEYISDEVTVGFQEEEFSKNNNYAGFNWSDFCNDKALNGLFLNKFWKYAHGDCLGYIANIKTTKSYLNQTGLKAFFRGHQDKSFGFKMLFDQDIDFSKGAQPIANYGYYLYGPYHWKYIVNADDQVSHNGFQASHYAPVFTFTSASEGQGVPYDCFGFVTTGATFDQWRIKPYEMQLPADRNEKFIKIEGLSTGEMKYSWVTKGDEAGFYGVVASQDFELTNKLESLKNGLTQLRGKLIALQDQLALLKQSLTQKEIDTTLLEALALDMKYYKTTNTGFHSGHLYEHSMWVAMVIDRWFEERSGSLKPSDVWEHGVDWVKDVDENDRAIMVLAGFLHDVGKASNSHHHYQQVHKEYFDTSHPFWPSYPSYHNIPSHPKDGFDFLTQNLAYQCSVKEDSSNHFSAAFRAKGYFDFNTLFKQLDLSDEQQKIIQILTGIHWDFGGEVMIKNNYKSFLDKLAKLVKQVDYNNGVVDERIVRLSILIGAADVRGAQSEPDGQNFDAFKARYSWFKSHVFEEPKIHKQYKQPQKRFRAFDFPGKGINRKNNLLNYFKNTWTQSQLIRGFNMHGLQLFCYFTPVFSSS